MRFTNLTRRTEIGANSYLLEFAGRHVVLDCGMHPKHEGEDALPDLRIVPDGELDAIVITHAHLDHIGSLPVLMRRQPRARVFMSPPTASARRGVVAQFGQRHVAALRPAVVQRPRAPSPSGRGGDAVVHSPRDRPVRAGLAAVRAGEAWSFEGDRLSRPGEADASFEFFDAGHILGSAGVLIRAEGRRVFYTGDVNFLDQTVSRAAGFPGGGPEEPIDTLIIETTRGDHPVTTGRTRADEEARLARALKDVFARDGAVLIPVFALGKTQEMLATFMRFKQDGLLGDVPIYIGGLSTKMTEIYDRFASSTPRRLPGVSLLHTVAPYVLSGREAGSSPIKPRRIYALSSGMMTEHTLSNVFARRMLADPRHAIFFVGYADPESPAGKLRAAKEGELVQLDEEAPAVERRAQVEVFDFSAHSQREDILAYIRRVQAKKVVLVHGDVGAIQWFKETLAQLEPQMEVIVPPPGEAVEI